MFVTRYEPVFEGDTSHIRSVPPGIVAGLQLKLCALLSLTQTAVVPA
jgi:hypothetical protein